LANVLIYLNIVVHNNAHVKFKFDSFDGYSLCPSIN
jgi:hypothetical protein